MNDQQRYRTKIVGRLQCQGCGHWRNLTRGHLDMAHRRHTRLLYCRACSARRVGRRKKRTPA